MEISWFSSELFMSGEALIHVFTMLYGDQWFRWFRRRRWWWGIITGMHMCHPMMPMDSRVTIWSIRWPNFWYNGLCNSSGIVWITAIWIQGTARNVAWVCVFLAQCSSALEACELLFHHCAPVQVFSYMKQNLQLHPCKWQLGMG